MRERREKNPRERRREINGEEKKEIEYSAEGEELLCVCRVEHGPVGSPWR